MERELTWLVRILLAAFLSGLIGLEREMHGRAAGLRTHILVGIGSCLIMLTSFYVHQLYGSPADPSRIAAQVVSGIGFLGAGTIIRFRASIRGLTTAASLWAVAGIGLAVGAGIFLPALFSTFVILFTLFILSEVERKTLRRSLYKVLQIETSGQMDQLAKIRKLLGEYRTEIRDLDLRCLDREKAKYLIEINLRILDKYEDELLRDLSRMEGVDSVKWM